MAQNALTLFIAATLLSVSAAAQSVHHKLKPLFHTQPPGWNIIQRQAQQQQDGKLLKTTSGQRLIDIRMHQYDNGNAELTDSASYIWSGMRDLDHYVDPIQLFYYDQLIPLYPLAGSAFSGIYNNFGQLKADSVLNFTANGTAFVPSDFNAFAYNAQDRPVTVNNYLSTLRQINYTNITYNTNGKFTVLETYTDTTIAQLGNYVPSFTIYYFYDANGSLIKDSTILYPLPFYSINTYQKNAAGLDTGAIGQDIEIGTNNLLSILRAHYEYTPFNQLRQAIFYGAANGQPEKLREKDSMGYVGTNTYPSYYKTKYYDGTATLRNQIQQFNNINTNGDVEQRMYVVDTNGSSNWDTTIRYHYYYNGYNNADSIVFDEHDGGWNNRAWSLTYRYTTPTFIPTVVNNIQLKAFPNPASASVTLMVPEGAIGSLAIYDLQGRLVKSYGRVRNAQPLDITGFAKGIYTLRFEGSMKGKVSGVTQLVVN